MNWQVLVVEDDINGQDVARGILEHYDITVDVADDAMQALELLRDNRYTAAIIDLSLPGMSGWELLEAMRADKSTADLPCVATTAYHSPRVAQDAIEAGFVAYFPKPMNVVTLMDDLRAVLGDI
jgi:CheY-like chemotaxis protein